MKYTDLNGTTAEEERELIKQMTPVQKRAMTILMELHNNVTFNYWWSALPEERYRDEFCDNIVDGLNAELYQE